MTYTHEHLTVAGHWIDGAEVPGEGGTADIISPVDGSLVASVPSGTGQDVARAVSAARTALPGWAATEPSERAAALRRLSEELTSRIEDVAQAVTAEIGVPISFSRMGQAGFPALVTAATADLEPEIAWTENVGNAVLVREPVGVVGAITPWNFPLQQVMTKIAPALLAGNTLVLKPAEGAPLTMRFLAEAAAAAAIPGGVLNIVYGSGPTVGEALVAHPGVDMISFTGSTRAGKRISKVAADTVKRVGLELGGKSANIILDGADLDVAVQQTLMNAWANAGQACGAWTRLLVPATTQATIVKKLREAAAAYVIGDPRDELTRMGPLASEQQWQRVNGYIERGIADGATLVCGGPGRVPGFESGAYIRPTIFADVDPNSAIAQEEIFGPVLSVIPYTDEDEAVSIANGTIYGLTAAVFGDPEPAFRVARRLEAGQVYLNGADFNPLAPFGGYKQSGNGREMGRAGVEEFTEVKSILL
ncbi:aldehyde dehydrogenase family protein [Microbacterium azadirachtae]|uniref:aldehyde dehydrogenase family protein n=1 Tax=Microbacterium azadirachtae TaxID=582680 RepID=UPI00087FACD6|nr:aldehyde dehydrogenase family protein [Microbacterium azadirachtae]SDL90944.1 aldehyde dehydrogenase (NAD+) [Microbacterium azadirachtae]SEG16771.1 aldehyde dehydrogenase (NAD+) [Microbacterium azadirachtae]SEG19275.1 aldehyde dehydrogenase (NAD+) [Microbacterium azadirachtae]